MKRASRCASMMILLAGCGAPAQEAPPPVQNDPAAEQAPPESSAALGASAGGPADGVMRLVGAWPPPGGVVVYVLYADGRLEVEGQPAGRISASPLEYYGDGGELRASLTPEGQFQTPSGPLNLYITDDALVGNVGLTVRFGPEGDLECYQDEARVDCEASASRMEGFQAEQRRLALFSFGVVMMVYEAPPPAGTEAEYRPAPRP